MNNLTASATNRGINTTSANEALSQGIRSLGYGTSASGAQVEEIDSYGQPVTSPVNVRSSPYTSLSSMYSSLLGSRAVQTQSPPELSEEEKEWRAALKQGDMVDAAYGTTWLIATISEVKEDSNEVEILFMELGDEYNVWVDRYDSTRLTKPNTPHAPRSSAIRRVIIDDKLPPPQELYRDPAEITEEEKVWRSELKVGDALDALDQQAKWFISEIKDSREIKLENGTETEFYIKYSEWTDRWNVWMKRSSNNLRMPYSVSRPRSEQEGMDSLRIVTLTSPMPDYSNISTELLASTITFQALPKPIGKGNFLRIGMPKDNSCMFHSISFTCEGKPKRSRDLVLAQRLRVAQYILAEENKETYAEVVLGQSPESYVDHIKRLHAWGGAIELGILSKIFQVQIVAIDVTTCTVYCFPDSSDTEHQYERRVFVAYTEVHYDVLAFMPAGAESHALGERKSDNDEQRELDRIAFENVVQEVFHVDDSTALRKAIEHAGLLHMIHHKKFSKDISFKGMDNMEAKCDESAPPAFIRQVSDSTGLRQESRVPMLTRAHSVELPQRSPGRATETSSKEADF